MIPRNLWIGQHRRRRRHRCLLRRTLAAPLVVFAGYTLNAILLLPCAVVCSFQQQSHNHPQSRWVSQTQQKQKQAQSTFHNRQLLGGSSSSSRTTTTTKTTSARYLFFRAGDDNNNNSNNDSSPPPLRRIPLKSGILEELKSSSITFPFNNVMFEDGSSLSIRFMEPQDMKDVIPICIEEFGTGPTAGILDFPITNPQQIPNWWDRLYFQPMVEMSLRAKMNANYQTHKHNQQTKEAAAAIESGVSVGEQSSSPSLSLSTTRNIQDPAMLVLCRRLNNNNNPRKKNIFNKNKKSFTRNNTNNNNNNYSDDDTTEEEKVQEQVIGMVELSLQVPDANKNPPPYPIPTQFKEMYCNYFTKHQRLEGWVTNLLIDPNYRGLGYSKILMAATEGIAKSWGRNHIYLHADADYKSGRVAQKLYESLGYQVVVDDNPQYSWMSGGTNSEAYNPFSSIRMIEGVALLCYCKKL